MNYKRAYDCLIGKAKERSWSKSTAPCYVELHHVVPKCLGGCDDLTNLVYLSAREHFVAHLLLVKVYPTNNKLVYAAHMLTRGSQKHNRVSNREYQWLKERRSIAFSNLFKGIPKSESHKLNMKGKRPHVNQKGSNNNAFKGMIQTPFGIFDTLQSAALVEGVDFTTISYRIHSTSDKFTNYKRLPF